MSEKPKDENLAEAERPVASAKELKVLEDAPDELEEYPEDYPDYYSSVGETLVDEGAINILTKREDVRGRLAIIYTIATFTMFVLGFLVAILDSLITKNSLIDNLTTILPLLSGIFLGTLGFVLGYYFRQTESDDSN